MTSRTASEALSVAHSGLGQWWPNAWWPGGNSTFNDCAAFVSWALYGLAGGRPAYTYVPHLMERAIRERRWYGGSALAGRPQDGRHAAGMVLGDVVILDWRFRGSRDHVGLFLGYVGSDYIRVRQANNGGGGNGNANTRDPAEDVTYHRRFVLGYYRPPYRTTSPAGGNITPIGETMPKSDEWFEGMRRQIDDLQLRVASMHAGEFKPVNGGPGGTLVWLDKAIDKVLARLPEVLAKQVGDIQDRVASMHVGQYLPIRDGAPGGDLTFLDKKVAEIQTGVQVDVEPAAVALEVAKLLLADPEFAEGAALSVAERAELEQYRAERARRREQLQAELASLGGS